MKRCGMAAAVRGVEGMPGSEHHLAVVQERLVGLVHLAGVQLACSHVNSCDVRNGPFSWRASCHGSASTAHGGASAACSRVLISDCKSCDTQPQHTRIRWITGLPHNEEAGRGELSWIEGQPHAHEPQPGPEAGRQEPGAAFEEKSGKLVCHSRREQSLAPLSIAGAAVAPPDSINS